MTGAKSGQRPLAGLTRHNIGGELLAGLTLVAIAIPLNIGYAQIAGLPASAGLYALVVPTAIYALVVSSRQLVASPDAAAAALVASSVGGLAVAGSAHYVTLALAQAIISGALLLLLAVFKLGFLADFLSKPILVGFVGGLALDILISQVAKMLGISLDPGGEFVGKVSGLASGVATANPWSALIAACALAILIFGRRVLPAIPWALIVLVLATLVVVVTGAERAGVAILGEIPAGTPPLTWPLLDPGEWIALLPSAAALTLVTVAEGLLISRGFAERRHYPNRPNRDLLALGLANVASGASGSFAVGSSTSRTAAMDQAGSRTQLPSLVLAAGTLLLLIFGTRLLAGIPSPAIGAIVAVAVFPLLGIREFASLWRMDRFEFTIAAVCVLTTLFAGSLAGIAVAFTLALVNLARRAAAPPIDVLAEAEQPGDSLLEPAPVGALTAPGVLVIRMAAPLFFANATVFTETVKSAISAAGAAEAVEHVVVDMEAITDVDVTGAEAFASLREWLANEHIQLAFARVRPHAERRMRRLGILRVDSTIYPTNRSALAALERRKRS